MRTGKAQPQPRHGVKLRQRTHHEQMSILTGQIPDGISFFIRQKIQKGLVHHRPYPPRFQKRQVFAKLRPRQQFSRGIIGIADKNTIHIFDFLLEAVNIRCKLRCRLQRRKDDFSSHGFRRPLVLAKGRHRNAHPLWPYHMHEQIKELSRTIAQ